MLQEKYKRYKRYTTRRRRAQQCQLDELHVLTQHCPGLHVHVCTSASTHASTHAYMQAYFRIHARIAPLSALLHAVRFMQASGGVLYFDGEVNSCTPICTKIHRGHIALTACSFFHSTVEGSGVPVSGWRSGGGALAIGRAESVTLTGCTFSHSTATVRMHAHTHTC